MDPSSAVTPGTPADRPLAVLFGATVLLQAAIVFALPYFVTADGATHVGGAAALADALFHRNGLAADFATIQILPLTNLIPELPLAILGQWIGPQWAEKVVVAGYVVGLPAATVYAIRGVEPKRWWLAFVAIPLTFTFVLNEGLYNYCYGLIGLVIGAGFVVRHRRRWTLRSTVGLTALATLVYVAHVLPFAQLVLLFGIVGLFDWRASDAGWRLAGLRQVVPFAIAAAPGLALSAALIAAHTPTVGNSTFSPAVSLAFTLALAWGMVTFDVREIAFTTVLAATLAVLATLAAWGRLPLRNLRRVRSTDAYLLFGFAALVEVAVIPSGMTLGSGGSFVAQRLGFVPVLGLLLWIADQRLPIRWPAILAVSSVVAAVGLLALRLPAYITLSEQVEAYASVAPCLATDATMLQANLGRVVPGPLDRTDQLSDEAGRLTAETHGWPVANVEFEVGFFSLRNRADLDPYQALIPVEARTTPVWEPIQRIPPSVDLLGFEQEAGRPIDYLLLFGRVVANPETLGDAAWVSLDAQLDRSYRHVATSPNRLLEVYERLGSGAAVRGLERRAEAPERCPPV